jgi:hypothetical protein
MNFQQIDKIVKDKIESLEQSQPLDSQWVPEKSWDKLSQRQGKSRKLSVVYVGSRIAACIVLLILINMLFENGDLQKIRKERIENLSQNKWNDLPQENKKAKGFQKTEEKLIKPYNHTNKIDGHLSSKPLKTNRITAKNPAVKKDITSNPPIANKNEENLSPNLFEDTLYMAKQNSEKSNKRLINQEVTLTIAPEARLKSDKKRKDLDTVKSGYLADYKKDKFKIKIKSQKGSKTLTAGKEGVLSSILTAKIKLSNK